MILEDFYKKAAQYLIDEKPFVLYRKPATQASDHFAVEGFFQEDNQLYTVEDYQEAGFVFAPFQLEKKVILIPLEKAEHISTTVEIQTVSSEEKQRATEVSSEEGREQHLQLVSEGIEAIAEGRFKKVVLSRELHVPFKKNPIEIFQELLQIYPTAFTYCWFHSKVGLWIGATPETLLSVSGNRLKTMSVAGTKAIRQNDKMNDDEKKKEESPIWTSKEIDEQQIVTDAIEAALDGKVERLSAADARNYRAGNLWHLKTDISGVISSEATSTLKNIVESLHPTPAVCGLPKEEAKNFILANEHYDREFYSGFLGELNLKTKKTRSANRRNQENQAYAVVKKETHLFVNLRCMRLSENRASLFVGGGIVKDSIPENEWEETQHKSQTMLKVL